MQDNRINPNEEDRELGIEFYYYSGGILEHTSSFCKEKVGKYFHFKEVMDWANTNWEGKHPKTDEITIFKYVGGYCCLGDKNEECIHSLMGVSSIIVDKEDLIRCIEKNYFTPSQTDRLILGLD